MKTYKNYFAPWVIQLAVALAMVGAVLFAIWCDANL